MPKRGSSIRVRKSGRYEARYRDPDGHLRSKTFGTEDEAKAFLIDTRKEVKDKTWVDPDLGRQTLKAVAAQWISHERARAKARPSTLDRYERTLQMYAEATFGTRQIATITSTEIETWAIQLRDPKCKEVTPRTKRSAFFPLQATFAYAARHRLIGRNPCVDVRLPEGNSVVTGHFLSREQVAAVAGEAAKTDAVYGLMVRFAAGTGLRASEMTGLRVRDVLVKTRQVNVERTVKKAHPADWIVDEPKSKRSKRKVPILDDDLLADLTAYVKSHPRKDDLDAPLWPGRTHQGLDYGTRDALHYWNQSAFYRNVFRPAVKAVGLSVESRTGVRWHDLRHTCISQWLEDGNLMYEVSRWAGHASYAFTDAVYAKVAEQPDYTAALERTRAAKAAKKAPVLVLPTEAAG